MHQLGLIGMPRRVYTYPDGMGWNELNLLASIGAGLIAASVAVFIANDLEPAARRGRRRQPLERRHLGVGDQLAPAALELPAHPGGRRPRAAVAEPIPRQVVTGLRSDVREVLVTGALDAEPDHRSDAPAPSIWPFLAAAMTTGLFCRRSSRRGRSRSGRSAAGRDPDRLVLAQPGEED